MLTMKSISACLILIAVFTELQAAPAIGLKNVADEILNVTISLERNPDFYRNLNTKKFLTASDNLYGGFNLANQKLREFFNSNSESLTDAEVIKGEEEELHELINNTLNELNSPDVKNSTPEIRDIDLASLEKISQYLNELAQLIKPETQSTETTLTAAIHELSESWQTFQVSNCELLVEWGN